MIEYFLRHYEAFAERIVIYDDDSDDGSKEILLAHNKVEVRQFVRSDHDSLELSRIATFNHCWKEARGTADWVIIVDCDEFVFHPRIDEYFATQKHNGVTIIPTLGFQMVTDQFPGEGEYLAKSHTRGCPFDRRNKPCVFDPSAIREINFSVGMHSAQPVGLQSLPPKDELMLLHYKYLGVDYLCCRHLELSSRRGSVEKANQWSSHWENTAEQLRGAFDSYKARSVDISAPGFSPGVLHAVPPWRKDASSPTRFPAFRRFLRRIFE